MTMIDIEEKTEIVFDKLTFVLFLFTSLLDKYIKNKFYRFILFLPAT